jgi:hypothetical protein
MKHVELLNAVPAFAMIIIAFQWKVTTGSVLVTLPCHDGTGPARAWFSITHVCV